MSCLGGGDAVGWLHGWRVAFPCFLPVWGYCLGLQMVVVFSQGHFDMHTWSRALVAGRFYLQPVRGNLSGKKDMGEGRIEEQHRVEMI